MLYPATAALVTACLGMHAYLGLQTEAARVAFEDTWGMTPAFLNAAPSWREALTLVTSLFIHQGLGTLVACTIAMVALAPRVERKMGSVGFLLFFGASGVIGGLWRAWSQPGVIVPQCGAGAAVSGVALAWLLSRISAGQSRLRPVRHTPSIQFAEMAS